jgi:hypothetical protein
VILCGMHFSVYFSSILPNNYVDDSCGPSGIRVTIVSANLLLVQLHYIKFCFVLVQMSTIWSEYLSCQNGECFCMVIGSWTLTNITNQLCVYHCVQFGLGREIFFRRRIIPCYFSIKK